VSQPRFMPVTSSLLARKGDAVPSPISAKPSRSWSDEKALPPLVSNDASSEAPAPKPHRMVVTLSASEFEKLGIAAVKKNVTRHQIVRTALELHLERLKSEFCACGCLAVDGSCLHGCGAG
jgi:hypothetical protein